MVEHLAQGSHGAEVRSEDFKPVSFLLLWSPPCLPLKRSLSPWATGTKRHFPGLTCQVPPLEVIA